MPRNASAPLVAIALVALAIAPAINVASAGEWTPIFDDQIVASVQVGDSVYVALPQNKVALEQAHNTQATVDTLGSIITQAPAATAANEFVMYGCYAAGKAVIDLESKGYDRRTDTTSSFAGADYEATYTD